MESSERPTKFRKLDGNGSDDFSAAQCIKITNSVAITPGDPNLMANAAGEHGRPVGDESNNEQQSDFVRRENLDLTDTEVLTVTNEDKDGQPKPQNHAGIEPTKLLSKNQQKKLRKKAEWEAKAEERRSKRREEHKRKRQRRNERMKAQEKSPKMDSEEKRHKARSKGQQFLVPVTFVIDCDFNDLMLEHELKSLASQITRCYSDNRNALYRTHIAVSSFGGALKERFEGPLRNQHKNWDRHIKFLEGDFVQVAEDAKLWMTGERGGKIVGALADSNRSLTTESSELSGMSGSGTKEHHETECEGDNQALGGNTVENNVDVRDEASAMQPGEIVYLSSESDEVLTELKPCSTYIIGGLVDHNRHKGICYKRAREKGIRTARLPIGEYLKMASRQVLATNHVCEIMLNWLSCGDWASSFVAVIPKRKEWSLKDEANEPGKLERTGSLGREREDENSHNEVEENSTG